MTTTIASALLSGTGVKFTNLGPTGLGVLSCPLGPSFLVLAQALAVNVLGDLEGLGDLG